MTSDPRKLKLSLMFFSKESTKVSTAIMAKMPTVTPNSERTVRRMLDFRALPANRKLSKIWRKVFIKGYNNAILLCRVSRGIWQQITSVKTKNLLFCYSPEKAGGFCTKRQILAYFCNLLKIYPLLGLFCLKQYEVIGIQI